MRRTGNKLKLKTETNISTSDKNVKIMTLYKFHACESDVETKICIQIKSNVIQRKELQCE